jgi:ribosomal protein S12 methylthiotransferase
MKVCMITLGCPKNVVDSEHLAARLFDNQVQFVDQADRADVVIINTCAFILPAREEAIETILEAVQLKNEGKVKQVYVTGCLPQRYISELQMELPEVDGFFDEYDFAQIGKKLSQQLQLNSPLSEQQRVLQTPAHYAYLKIAEGCDNRCHYCTIPDIKGSYRERPMRQLVSEVGELAEKGVRELILVAQDTTYYGWKQGNKKQLCELVRSIEKIDPIKWIRVLYAHPAHVADCLIELFKESEKLCRYIDLPIQHISDKMLKAMGRHATAMEVQNLIERLRKNVPEIAIRTTVMVGYPGEAETDFEILKNFIITTEFERLGVFQYSAEDGTPAAAMEDQVSEDIKADRFEELMEIQSEIALKKNQQLLNETIEVIIDEYDENEAGFIGRTRWDAPSIDHTVHVSGDVKVGHIYPVRIDRVMEYDLWGKVINLD